MRERFRIDCHVHTSRHSACSSMPPEQACAVAVERGLHALVLTEHHYQWTAEELADLGQKFPTLHLYAGAEITLAEGHDVVVIGDAVRLELPHGCPLAVLAEMLTPVRAQVFAFVAHAFRWADAVSPEAEDVFRWADGLEMNSINILRSSWRWREGRLQPANRFRYDAAQADYGLVPLYNSDAHHAQSLGRIAGELPGAPPADADGLAALLRRARQQEWQDATALSAYLY